MGRSEDLDMVLLDQFTQKLPELRHHRVVEAVVDLIDQKDPVPGRDQLHDDREQADNAFAANSSGTSASSPMSR